MHGQLMPNLSTRPQRDGLLLLGLLLTAAVAGCTDIRIYDGEWTGHIIRTEYLRKGLSSETAVTLTVTSVDLGRLEGFLTLTPTQEQTAGCTDATLLAVATADNDVIGDLKFDGDPLATYLFHVKPDDPAEEHYLLILSVHPERAMQLRLIRHDLYGVFKLNQAE